MLSLLQGQKQALVNQPLGTNNMNMTRKGFLIGTAAFAAVPALAKNSASAAAKSSEIRSVLLHWGLNQWGESLPSDIKGPLAHSRLCNDKVKFNDGAWNMLVDDMVAKRMNMVVIDLGEFPVYPSHPELALPGSRSPDWIRGEVRRLKSLGLEPIPKLNFSTGHDAWLGEYSRMVTTRKYYQVCGDVIKDVAEMFDHPRFLHIGYDEEVAKYQYGFQCVRVGEVWWHDFLFFVKTVEANGMRPWMWSDYGWEHADFAEKCPKQVIQSNWYYSDLEQTSNINIIVIVILHNPYCAATLIILEMTIAVSMIYWILFESCFHQIFVDKLQVNHREPPNPYLQNILLHR